MFKLQWLSARGICRGKPGLPGGHGRRLAVLGLLVLTSLLETGCQSAPCSPCGIVNRTTAFIQRTFRRNRSEPCCGAGVVADGGCVSSGVPVETIGTPVVAPAFPSATPSNVLPQDSPSNLEALPKAEPGPAQSIRRVPPATGSKTNSSYETLRPQTGSTRSRSDNLAHTLISTPVPAARSAQDPSSTLVRDTADASGADSILDHMPPLDLPTEATDKKVTPPVAPAAERKPPSSAPASDHLTGRSVREPQVKLTVSAQPAPEPAPAAGGVPGIARFVAVDLKLAGGSTPSAGGLDWLTEKGYKTLVDLRESSETSVGFIAEVARRGLRYIPLPVDSRSIDRAHVDRFNFELATADARPIFFFDSDGTRSAALWYIRRITVDRVDRQIARREAEELGLSNSEDLAAATRYLEGLETQRAQISETPEPQASVPSTQNSATSPPSQASPAPAGNRQDVPAKPADPAKKPRASQAHAEPGNTVLLTGLTLPLAGCGGRFVVPLILVRNRASLPAPGRQSPALPPALDA